MRSEIVIPTYSTWDDVPSNASLVPGDILPDGSTVEFASRTINTTANVTASWGGYDVGVDSPPFPTTAKDMSNMHKYQDGDILYGTQAQKNQWHRNYKRDLDKADDSGYENGGKVYVDTFKPLVLPKEGR